MGVCKLHYAYCNNPQPRCSVLELAFSTAEIFTHYCNCPVRMCVCVRSNLPPHRLESQKQDTNRFITIREHFLKGDFAKNVSFKSYGEIC